MGVAVGVFVVVVFAFDFRLYSAFCAMLLGIIWYWEKWRGVDRIYGCIGGLRTSGDPISGAAARKSYVVVVRYEVAFSFYSLLWVGNRGPGNLITFLQGRRGWKGMGGVAAFLLSLGSELLELTQLLPR